MQSGWGLAALVAAMGFILAVVLIVQAVGNLWVAAAIVLGPVGITVVIVSVLRGPRRKA